MPAAPTATATSGSVPPQSSSAPCHLSVPVSGRVFAVALTPPSVTPTLLAVGLHKQVAIVQLAFPEEQEQEQGGAGEQQKRELKAFLLREINHEGRVHSLAWPHSPPPAAAYSSAFPAQSIVFASGSADGQVKVFRLGSAAESDQSDGGGDTDGAITLSGHTDYVNTVAFQPISSAGNSSQGQ